MSGFKVILAGCGNMGFAMLQGWLADGVLKPENVHVVEPDEALRNRAAGADVNVHQSASDLPEARAPDLIVMAVKPQVMADVLAGYRRFADGTSTFLSVAAGVRVTAIENGLSDPDVPVIRVMPNTPSAIGKGMMVMFAKDNVPAKTHDLVSAMLAASGEVATIDDEGLMDAVTALSGSGPAYVFHMIEAMRDAGIAAGLPEAIARLLAMQTVYGAACYAKESGEEPGVLRQQVTSPGGTTAAALSVLMDDDRLRELMKQAVMAARDRSIELGN